MIRSDGSLTGFPLTVLEEEGRLSDGWNKKKRKVCSVEMMNE